MTKMIQLRALRPFPYGKHRLAVGEVFDVNETLARVFLHEGRAAHLEAVSPVDLPAEVMTRGSKREPITEEDDVAEEVKAKPAAPLYQTRHMEAEKPKAAERPAETSAPKRRGRPAGKAKRSQS